MRIPVFIKSILLGSVACLLTNCNRSTEDVVVEVYNRQLTREDLQKMIPAFDPNSDSVMVRQEYIDAWIARQALLQEAENYLSPKEKKFEKEVEEYRQSLVIHAYEKKRTEQLLDKNVAEEEINRYYEQHKSNFRLRQPIIKINYLKFPFDSPIIKSAKPLLFTFERSESELNKLESLVSGHATNIYLSDDWLLFEDILKEIPLDKEKSPSKGQTFEISDSVNTYLVQILDFQINEGYSPINIERENIIYTVLQDRRMKILLDLREDAVKKAKETGEVLSY
ncbi:MAG: hypothetical protein LBH82_01620 [Bacteroidales bacterium]|jgi:hypothetical protein|nr:hypothetical protein [Bacteroidales bacterium]